MIVRPFALVVPFLQMGKGLSPERWSDSLPPLKLCNTLGFPWLSALVMRCTFVLMAGNVLKYLHVT